MSSHGTRITFYGFAAYVGSLRGPTHCEWWPDDPNSLGWAPGAMIATDLSKNPTAARTNQISIHDIQVDDHRTDGGLTSIGPRFPQGTMLGAIWLTEWYWSTLGAKAPPRPASKDAHDYELTSLLYLDGPFQGRRYYGVHGRIVGTPHGPLHRVRLWHPGRGRVPNEPHFGEFWIDLGSDVHPVEPGATTVDPANPEGALFLEERVARQLSVRDPKLPPYLGSELL